MKKRVSKRITCKQANIITLIFSAILLVLLIILIIVCISQFGAGTIILSVIMGLACISAAASICWVLLQSIADPKTDFEEKVIVTSFLNKKDFTEISFTPQYPDRGESIMTSAIMRKIGCNFFAKLNENDDIILIVKDKDSNEIYRCEISNYSYFNLRFKEKI